MWGEIELSIKIGRPLSSGAYSTTEPDGKPDAAPSAATVDSVPILQVCRGVRQLRVHAHRCQIELNRIGCRHFIPPMRLAKPWNLTRRYVCGDDDAEFCKPCWFTRLDTRHRH